MPQLPVAFLVFILMLLQACSAPPPSPQVEQRQTAQYIAEDLLADENLILQDLLQSLVTIPAGSFQMGDSNASGDNEELPVHTVAIASFAIAPYEVTFQQYDLFARTSGRALPDDQGWGREQRPVINVSWEDTQA